VKGLFFSSRAAAEIPHGYVRDDEHGGGDAFAPMTATMTRLLRAAGGRKHQSF
jgi:hypothetical protein